jgi:hypothetical protein
MKKTGFSFKQQAVDTPSFTPLSPEESECLEHSRHFQQEMRDGPFYAFLETDARAPKPGELSGSGVLGSPSAAREAAAAAGSPFESMRTYSQRFVKAKRTMPQLTERKYGAYPPSRGFFRRGADGGGKKKSGLSSRRSCGASSPGPRRRRRRAAAPRRGSGTCRTCWRSWRPRWTTTS